MIFAPFIFCYSLIYVFFKYFEESYKNPRIIGNREYSISAQWKFKEFNELPHYFMRRLNNSSQIADQYLDAFPKEKTLIISRYFAIISLDL